MDRDFWYQPPTTTGPIGESTVRYSVVDFGAVGNGVTDDRVAIQRCIDVVYAAGGGVVYLPAGTYVVSEFSTLSYCLLLKHNVTLEGESRDTAIIKLKASANASVRLIYTNYLQPTHHNQTVRNLTLDGNKSAQTASEHRHGLMAAYDTTGLTIENVKAQNCTGDGLYLHNSTNAVVRNVYCTLNDRNGFTMGGAVFYPLVTGSTFVGNAVQQVDSEPPTDSLIVGAQIVGNVIDGRASTDYALTCGGNYDSDLNLSYGYEIRANMIYGPVYFAGCRDSVLAGNQIINHTLKAAVEIYRSCHRIRVEGNGRIENTNAAMVNGVVYLQGVLESFEDVPIDCTVEGNGLFTNAPDGYGVRADSIRSVAVRHNNIVSTAATATTFAAGVYCRATVSTPKMFQDVTVEHNTIKNFGKYGVWFNGATHLAAQAKIQRIRINENMFIDDQSVATMTIGIGLDPLNQDPLVEVECVDNGFTGIDTEIQWLADVPVLFDYAPDTGRPIYVTPTAPEGFIAAPVGSMAIVETGGVFGATYEKRSGTGSTGWVLVA